MSFTQWELPPVDLDADQLSLKPEIDDVKTRIRYASAMFDWELTQIGGA